MRLIVLGWGKCGLIFGCDLSTIQISYLYKPEGEEPILIVLLSNAWYNRREVSVRTTKVVAFSVPPEFECLIHQHAKDEHRTVSEYLREAVRKYMSFCEFNVTQKAVSKRLRRHGLKPSDIEGVLKSVRKRA